MSTLVNLLGEDIATNSKLNELLAQLKDATGQGDFQRRIEATPNLENPSQIYIAVAPTGALETDLVWAIQLILITPTSVSIRMAKDAAWTNRANEVYL